MNMAGQHKRLSPLDMLLSCVTVSCLLFGSSTGLTYKNKCIGSSMRFSAMYSPPAFRGKMYFTPSGGGSKKIIMDKGKAMDPRLKLYYRSAELRDLTKRDEGTFSVSFFYDADGNKDLEVIRLNMLDCSDKVTEYYGAKYSSDVPSDAEFLQFTHINSEDQPTVIWNHTDPQSFKGGRGRVTRNGRSWTINDLTQADNGHYNFRGENNTLLKGIQLEVKEHNSHFNAKVNEKLVIKNLFGGSLWTVTFKPDTDASSQTLIEEGELVRYRYRFTRRIWLNGGDIEINPVESGDSGTFEFRDQQGNLAQMAEVVVESVAEEEHEEISTAGIFSIIAVNVFLLGGCCYCVRRCCCKTSSSKRDESTLPVFHHDSTQPAAPSSSAAPAPHHSYQPVNSHVPKEPAASSFRPSMYTPVNIHVNPPQPEVAPLREERTDPAPSLGSDCLSSDPGPQFEIKGLPYLTALPLSSESTFTDVYTSDKLN